MIVRTAELHLGVAQQTAACNALHDVQSRLCRWVLQTSDKTDNDVIPFTRSFSASSGVPPHRLKPHGRIGLICVALSVASVGLLVLALFMQGQWPCFGWYTPEAATARLTSALPPKTDMKRSA
jgi:hypothetical protein